MKKLSQNEKNKAKDLEDSMILMEHPCDEVLTHRLECEDDSWNSDDDIDDGDDDESAWGSETKSALGKIAVSLLFIALCFMSTICFADDSRTRLVTLINMDVSYNGDLLDESLKFLKELDSIPDGKTREVERLSVRWSQYVAREYAKSIQEKLARRQQEREIDKQVVVMLVELKKLLEEKGIHATRYDNGDFVVKKLEPQDCYVGMAFTGRHNYEVDYYVAIRYDDTLPKYKVIGFCVYKYKWSKDFKTASEVVDFFTK